MGIAIFCLLTLIVAGLILYPLLPGRIPAAPALAVTDGDIVQAVRNLRRTRSRDGLDCPTCGKDYQEGDRFCVRCGGALPLVAPPGPVCPSCSAALHKGDLFCAKCGHKMAPAEAA